MANIRTLESAVIDILSLINRLSEESREDCQRCAVDLFELTKEEDNLKGMQRSTEIMLDQMEVDRRVRFLDGITETIREYMELCEFA